ncbi:MAG: serine/threonine protein kinase [Phycisphaerales bacterium]|nr:MAG: serine/threonine protein kinase [Phycisphaerales bacterium]
MLHVIGSGASGTVWLAEETLSGLQRAVKLLPKGEIAVADGATGAAAAGSRELDGLREYQRVAERQPHLLQIFHVGESDGFFYYVMQLADPAPPGVERAQDGDDPARAGDDLAPAGDDRAPAGAAGEDRVQSGAASEPRASARADVPAGTPLPMTHADLNPASGTIPPPPEAADASTTHSDPHCGATLRAKAYRPLTLKELIRTQAPLDPAKALDITRQVLEGLATLHAHGLTHRDVKPDNVLMVDGQVRLADVGLVANLDHTLTQVGTPGYMPPEGAVDQRADLYAVGIMLYEMITGYPRTRFPELPRFDPMPRGRRRAFRVANRVATQGAAWDRRARFQSAADFLRALDHGGRRRSLRPTRWRWVAAGALSLLALTWGATHRVHLRSAELVAGERSVRVTGDWGRSWVCGSFDATLGRPVLADVDGDGRAELVVAVDESFPRASRDAGKLFAYAGYLGRLRLVSLWDEPVRLYATPPWKTRTAPESCGVRVNQVADLDNRLGQELVVSAKFPGACTRIAVVGQDGRILGDYWHYGYMDVYAITDLDGDGARELICVGLMNHPEDERGQELLSPAVMILNVGPGGTPSRATTSPATPNRATPNRAMPNRAMPNRAAPIRAATVGEWFLTGRCNAGALLPESAGIRSSEPAEPPSPQAAEPPSPQAAGVPSPESAGAFSPGGFGSLRAYGRLRSLATAPTGGEYTFHGDGIHMTYDGQDKLELVLAQRLILILDSHLRPIEGGVRPTSSFDPALPIPPIDALWQPLWPPAADIRPQSEP